MTLDVYGHVFDEFDPAERIPADEQIRRARETDMSEECPPTETADPADEETPGSDYSPNVFPKISFMSLEGVFTRRRHSCTTHPLLPVEISPP